jgi:hypothetical protein
MTIWARHPKVTVATDSSPIDGLIELLLAKNRPWAEQAHCAQTDPESFFPEKGQNTHRPSAEAKAICWGGCPVRAECLQWAMENNERYGVWGGYTEQERHRLRKGEDVTPWNPLQDDAA